MATLAYQSVTQQGAAITPVAAAAGGDSVAWNPRGALWVKNGSGVSVTVTLVVPGTEYGQARPDVAVVVPAGADRFVGPLERDLADPADGLVDFTYSAVTSVAVAAVLLPAP